MYHKHAVLPEGHHYQNCVEFTSNIKSFTLFEVFTLLFKDNRYHIVEMSARGYARPASYANLQAAPDPQAEQDEKRSADLAREREIRIAAERRRR